MDDLLGLLVRDAHSDLVAAVGYLDGHDGVVRVRIAARRDVYLFDDAVDVGDDLAAGDDAVFVLLAALERGDLGP